MPAVLGTNVASLWASNNLQSAQSNMANSVERLSSGLRINRARDDAAGLGVANALTQQINGANQGIKNLNDGISIVQTAEGAIQAASDMAQRIMALATQGSNGTLSTDGRTSIKNELVVLLASIDKIKARTMFNGITLLAAPTVTIASSNVVTDTIDISAGLLDISTGGSTGASSAGTLNTKVTALVSTAGSTWTDVMTAASNYITALDTQRGKLGALQNQMDYSVANITELSSNLQSARSRVVDTDYASETASLTKGQILQQAATAMLAQANQMPNVILTLLK
jgi:flagellin